MKNIIRTFTVTFCVTMLITSFPMFSNAQCTCPGGYLCVPTGAKATDYSYNAGGYYEFPSSPVYFEGTFEVDYDFHMTSISALCYKGAGITIDANKTLTINSSTITMDQTCCYDILWRGIESYGTLNCTSSTIELALVGLTNYSGSTFSIIGSIFNRCFIDIDFSGFSGSYSCILYGTRFECYTGGSPSAIDCGGYTTRTHVGIDITGLTSINIGDNSNSFNVFDNLDYGIYSSTYGGATIEKNQFYNFTSSYSGVADPTAIKLTNATTAQTLTIGGSTYARRNEFGNSSEHNDLGISITGKYNATIRNNIMDYTDYPVYVTNNNGTTGSAISCTIKDNSFSNFNGYGVQCYDNHGVSSAHTTIQVKDNAFDGGNVGAQDGTCIIVSESTSIPNYTDVAINNNGNPGTPINNIYGGGIIMAQIGGTGGGTPQIIENKLFDVCQDASTTGILIQSCDNVTVRNNAVKGFVNIAGIQVYNSTATTNSENWLAYSTNTWLGYGTLNNTKIICNHFDNATYGATISYAGATFPNNGNASTPTDNEWTNIGSYGIYADHTLLASKNWYIIQPVGCGSPPAATQTNSGNSGAGASSMTIANACGSSPCDTPLYKLEENEVTERDELIGDIVFNSGDYADMPEFDQYMQRVYAYEQLLIHPEYLDLGTEEDEVYQQFFEEQQNSNIGHFAQLAELSRERNIDDANTLNESITPENDRETYLQQLYSIYDRTIALQNRDYTGEDISLLYSVAYMDTRTTGDAPTMAQSMLRFFVHPNYGERLSFYNPYLKESLSIYPNPVADVAYFQINLYQPGAHELTVYDLTGKALLSYNLTKPYGNLDVSNFQAGCYFVKLSHDGKLISTSKFIKK